MSTDRALKSRPGRTLAYSALMLVALSGAAAQAASVSTTGSTASNSDSLLTVTDTVSEGDDAYTNWNSNGHNRIQTSGGKGASNSVTVDGLSNFRACRDQGSLNPDNCSSYVSP